MGWTQAVMADSLRIGLERYKKYEHRSLLPHYRPRPLRGASHSLRLTARSAESSENDQGSMNPSAGSITGNYTVTAMKLRGGPRSASTRRPSRQNCGGDRSRTKAREGRDPATVDAASPSIATDRFLWLRQAHCRGRNGDTVARANFAKQENKKPAPHSALR
jgi:hypothetical protein